jgi:hypothetical protein
MIISTRRYVPEVKWIQPGNGPCPACHQVNNWVGYQVKQYSGLFWISIIPMGSTRLIMCDVCNTFFGFGKVEWKAREDSYSRGVAAPCWIPEQLDSKGRLKGELKPGFWSPKWASKLAELKKSRAQIQAGLIEGRMRELESEAVKKPPDSN